MKLLPLLFSLLHIPRVASQRRSAAERRARARAPGQS